MTKPLLLVLVLSIFSCQDLHDGNWKSGVSNLELSFSNDWKMIQPYTDTADYVLAGLTDTRDNASFTVKIRKDVPQDVVSDDYFFRSIREQMLNANPENELFTEDTLQFKERTFHRFIFLMTTKYGKVTHTAYTHRTGEHIIGIQFTYPRTLSENPSEEIPLKIEKLLNEMKL